MTDIRYWQWWMDKLAGKNVRTAEGDTYAGFYRWVRKTRRGIKFAIPIAYWPDEEGLLHCREGFGNVTAQRGQDIWVNVHNHPVPEEWYRSVAEEDAAEWPDGMATAVPAGDNLPPVDFDDCRRQIEELSLKARDRLLGPRITEQIEADKISNIADELTDLYNAADALRKTERKPHDEALQEITKKWAPVLLAAEVYKNLKYALLTPWQIAQKKELEEQTRVAVAAGEPDAAAEPARRPRAGTRSRAMTLKKFKSAQITDYDACLNHFRKHDNIRMAVQDLANKAVRVGIEVPGAKLIEEERTV